MGAMRVILTFLGATLKKKRKWAKLILKTYFILPTVSREVSLHQQVLSQGTEDY